MHSGENDAGSGPPARRVRRRDRHGRGLRGRLAPPGVPLYRTRSQQFDDMVIDAVARLEPRWGSELAGIEFGVQEVPDPEELADEFNPVPLARVVPGAPESGDPPRPATPTRIIVYRRPLLARAEGDDELSDLIFDIVVEEFAEILGIDPEAVDPSYRENGFD